MALTNLTQPVKKAFVRQYWIEIMHPRGASCVVVLKQTPSSAFPNPFTPGIAIFGGPWAVGVPGYFPSNEGFWHYEKYPTVDPDYPSTPKIKVMAKDKTWAFLVLQQVDSLAIGSTGSAYKYPASGGTMPDGFCNWKVTNIT